MAGWTSTTFRLAADRRRARRCSARRSTAAEGDRPAARPRPALRAYGDAGAGRRRADPGRAAPPGRAEVRRPRRADVLHPRRPRAGHPAAGRHPPGRPAAGGRRADGRRPRLRHRRRPGRLRPGRAHLRRRRPRPACASRSPAPTSPRSGSAARCRSPTRRRIDTTPFDVGVRRPGAPERRRAARFDVDDWTPPWSFVESLLTRRRRASRSRPGIPHDLVPDGVEAEWVSDHGEVKEAALWSGRLATARRRATVIGRRRPRHPDRRGRPGRRRSARVGEYLYEPDGAVIRAGLVTAVAAGVDGGLLDEHIAYVTVGRVVPHAVRPRLPGARGAAVPGEARCAPPCASAGSAG